MRAHEGVLAAKTAHGSRARQQGRAEYGYDQPRRTGSRSRRPQGQSADPTGVTTRPDVLPVLQLALGDVWELGDGGLWRRNVEQLLVRDLTRRPPPTPFALTPEQQREAIALVRSGKTLRAVGQVFGVSYGAIWTYPLCKRAG
jgi:hypothetical protein